MQRIGPHWIQIGFQRNDPKTDVRASGILGLINVLYLLEKYPLTMKKAYHHSLKEPNDFPFILKLLEVTTKVIKLTKSCKAYALYNRQKNVLEAQAQLVGVMFFKQMSVYIPLSAKIEHFSELNKATDDEIQRDGIISFVREWWPLSDEECLDMMANPKA